MEFCRNYYRRSRDLELREVFKGRYLEFVNCEMEVVDNVSRVLKNLENKNYAGKSVMIAGIESVYSMSNFIFRIIIFCLI